MPHEMHQRAANAIWDDIEDASLEDIRDVLAAHYDPIITVITAELAMWRRFASYCRCCAQSGESNPMDFETFKEMPANKP